MDGEQASRQGSGENKARSMTAVVARTTAVQYMILDSIIGIRGFILMHSIVISMPCFNTGFCECVCGYNFSGLFLFCMCWRFLILSHSSLLIVSDS